MRLAEVQAELRRRFAAAGERGHVVSWHDPKGEFSDTLETLDLPGVEVWREEEGARFALKRTLNGLGAGRKVLLYRACPPRPESDWLLDVEARAEQFGADLVSMQLRELGCADTPEMRSELTARKRFLSRRSHVRQLLKMDVSFAVPRDLELAIMAVALGVESASPVEVVGAWLRRVFEMGATDAMVPLEEAGVAGSLRAAVAAWTGFSADADADDAPAHVLLTALAQEMGSDALSGLKGHFSPVREHGDFCHEVFDAWAAGPERPALHEACRRVEQDVRLEALLEGAPDEALARAGAFPCAEAVALRRLLSEVARPDGADVLSRAAQRRAQPWYDELAPCYEGLVAAAKMRRFARSHSEGLGALSAARVWDAYVGEWCRVDRWYRDFHRVCPRVLAEAPYGLDEDFRRARTAIEALYKGWYLRELSSRWVSAAAADLSSAGAVPGIARQLDFYMAEVDGLARTRRRAWVVVSDAFRFEVASELAERLEQETTGGVELRSAQAALPSITPCGMSALLPHGSYEIAARGGAGRDCAAVSGSGQCGLVVLVDGEEAVGCAGRQRAMRRSCPTAVAVSYDEFVGNRDRAGRRELVDKADVVYVFHNVIDAVGDKRPTERRVFDACDDALDELSSLVKLIVREFQASDVVVSADHGFLYTDEPLAEGERASLSDVVGTGVVEAGRRYVVAEPGASSEWLVPATLPGRASLVGLFPRDNVRLKMAGGGENFVHGGISLQEMCVPVLRFHNRRVGSAGYVETTRAGLSLATQLSTVSNASFSLDLLQDEPVGGKVLPAEYEVYVADASRETVTNVARVVADATSDDAAERVHHVSLSVRSDRVPAAGQRCQLVARDVATGEVTTLRELRLQLAFAPSLDFDWLGLSTGPKDR